MKLRMTNQEFTNDLNDTESEEFHHLSEEYSMALAEVLSDVPGLVGVKILGFGNGSLLVYYELIFDDEIKTIPKVYEDENSGNDHTPEVTTSFDPVLFAQRVKNEVKDVLTKALSDPEERSKRLNHTILADANVDLDSVETIPLDVVEEFVKLNPKAPIVTIDLTTHHHDDEDNVIGKPIYAVEEPTTPPNKSSGLFGPEEGWNQPNAAAADEDASGVGNSPPEHENWNTTAGNSSLEDGDSKPELEYSNSGLNVSNPEIESNATSVNSTTEDPNLDVQDPSAQINSSNPESNDSNISNEELEYDYDVSHLDSEDDYMTDHYYYYDPLPSDIATPGDVNENPDDVIEPSVNSTIINSSSTTEPTLVTDVISAIDDVIDSVDDGTEWISEPMSSGDNVVNHSNEIEVTVATTSSTVTHVTSLYDVDSSVTTSGMEVEEGGSGAEENLPPGVSPISLSQTVFMKLRVTNMNFTKNLTDRKSEEFLKLEAKFLELINPLLLTIDDFLGLEVIGFEYGSLIVNQELYFRNQVPENVSEEVKKRIDAAAGYFQYAHVTVDTEATQILRPDEVNLCEFIQCHMFADCVVRTDYRTECVCRPGYVSVDPANCVSMCELEPGYCRNGGECHVVPGRGAICRCQVHYNWGYDGERCENLVPKSVLLVSSSTAVACLTFMILLAGTAYFFYRRRQRKRTERKKELADKDFMRAAQIVSPNSRSPSAPPGLQRINPVFARESEFPMSDHKDISSSCSPAPSTSSSSLNKSIGSTSTSSFFVREQLDNNGPLPGNMDTPERRMLHLQINRYPNHKTTWCGEERENTRRSQPRAKHPNPYSLKGERM